MSAPTYVTYTILLSSIGIIAAVLVGLRSALVRAGWEESSRVVTLRTATVLLPLWFVVALALSLAEFFRGAADRIPSIELGIFVPILIGLVWLWRSETANAPARRHPAKLAHRNPVLPRARRDLPAPECPGPLAV